MRNYEMTELKCLMKKRHYFNIIRAVLLLLILLPAAAHAYGPYERTDRIIETEDGKQISLIRSYEEGLLSFDPVKFVIRECEGCSPLLETDYVREVAVFCQEKKKCFILLYKDYLRELHKNYLRKHKNYLHKDYLLGAFSVTPDDMYEFEINDRKVTKIDALWLKLYGIAAPLKNRILQYFLAIIFLLIPAAVFFDGIRKKHQKRYSDAVSSGMLGIALLALWTVCVLGFSRLLLHLIAALAGITAAAAYFLYKTVKKRKAAVRNEGDRVSN